MQELLQNHVGAKSKSMLSSFIESFLSKCMQVIFDNMYLLFKHCMFELVKIMFYMFKCILLFDSLSQRQWLGLYVTFGLGLVYKLFEIPANQTIKI